MRANKRRLPAGVEQLRLFPSEVVVKPKRLSSPRSSCFEVGHSWEKAEQLLLFGFPPQEILYCTVCGKIFK
jgi:hypothetical protein